MNNVDQSSGHLSDPGSGGLDSTRRGGRSGATLKRGLSTPLLVLYGLGVTIGAGIYVLVGATAAEAGLYAPVSFLLSAVVVGFTGFSYAELATRYPVSAGEAAYVRAGLRSPTLSLAVGLLVAASGVVSASAIALGAAAYLQPLVPLPHVVLITLIVLLLGLAAAWGIVESVVAAGILTLVEIIGLALVVYFGLSNDPDILVKLPDLVPPMSTEVWGGILSATLLAFFAFIGFEDMVNVAEEVKNPERTIPRAIALTLVLSAGLYVMVVAVVVLSVPLDVLGASAAPLALVFDQPGAAGAGVPFALIAVVATVNGLLIQLIMASRVIYGLAAQGSLPRVFAQVNPRTRTPLVATALVVGIVLALALFLPIAELAETTSRIVLVVFALVNLALLRLKWSRDAPEGKFYRVPAWVPTTGLVSTVGMLLSTAI